MARIVITGGNGQLGRDCSLALKEHTVLSSDIPDVDITSQESIAGIAEKFRPEFIINCAAYTAVDQAESERDIADKINHAGPEILANICKANNIFLIHISTDYIFDGEKTAPGFWVESDTPNPHTVYGITKLAGERAIAEAGCRYAILRTAWLYGVHGKNFPKTMLRLAMSGQDRTIKVVNDQFGCPTWSYRLANQIAEFINRKNPPEGLFHAASEGYTTWFEFAKTFLELMGVPHSIMPCTTEEYPTPAKRPKNSILKNTRLESAGINKMDNWLTALKEYVLKYKSVLMSEN